MTDLWVKCKNCGKESTSGWNLEPEVLAPMAMQLQLICVYCKMPATYLKDFYTKEPE
jgi:hypothetical protein